MIIPASTRRFGYRIDFYKIEFLISASEKTWCR